MLSRSRVALKTASAPRAGLPRAGWPVAGSFRRPVGHGSPPPARASPSDSECEGVSPGDAALQSALEEQLRLRLKDEALKESIKEDIRFKVEEELRSKVDSIKQMEEEVWQGGG